MDERERTRTFSRRQDLFHTAHIELSESALRRNIRFLREVIGPGPVFSSVIKGNAYGHNIATFVPLAERCGVRHFSVYSAYEALIASRSLTGDSHIMIMGDIVRDAIGWAIEKGVSFSIFNVDWLRKTLGEARKIGKPARVHLEVETGMHRTGLEGADLDAAIDILEANPDLFVVDGVFTHYAGAECISNFVRVQEQIRRFDEITADLVRRGLKFRMRHSACSAAALRYPETIMDMVRFGIAQYGFWPNKETHMHFMMQGEKNCAPAKKQTNPLRRVMTWKSRIMNIKPVRRGEFVGYGNTYMTGRDQKIAAVPIGYYHGFARQLSNRGYVLVNGRRAQVVGIVNMNMMTVDVTDFPQVAVGDEVVIIGTQKKQQITVGSFSDLTPFLNYEVLARIPEEIPRIVVD
ncbi:MAG: alanine racemase [Candidatus Krumholzibacteriota bacterium]|nr:alanine racemase [Candidatus Krumholzibacteriota bacterium]